MLLDLRTVSANQGESVNKKTRGDMREMILTESNALSANDLQLKKFLLLN